VLSGSLFLRMCSFACHASCPNDHKKTPAACRGVFVWICA